MLQSPVGEAGTDKIRDLLPESKGYIIVDL